MSSKVEYVGKDLEAMDFAVNYHKWILSLIKQFLGEHLVEVGAGTGSFSELLLETKPRTISLVEPSDMFDELENKDLQIKNPETAIKTYKNIFSNVADEIKNDQPPTSVIYINVLEHIEDDIFELKTVNKTLSEKGKVIIFVPALTFLYSEFDKNIGHFRRYTKKELVDKCQTANFKVIMSRYFDFPGIIPWLIKYRWLKSIKMESGAVQLYDKTVVPLTQIFENILSPPIGKNLLLIAEKN